MNNNDNKRPMTGWEEFVSILWLAAVTFASIVSCFMFFDPVDERIVDAKVEMKLVEIGNRTEDFVDSIASARFEYLLQSYQQGLTDND